LPSDLSTWTPDQALQLAVAVLRGLNRRLSAVLGDDFLLGHAVLWSVAGSTAEQIVKSLALAFDEQVVGTLKLTFADQEDQLAAVLGIVGSTPVGTPRVARCSLNGSRLTRPSRLSARDGSGSLD
jgi:5-methylcytosine-specific restriction protein B